MKSRKFFVIFLKKKSSFFNFFFVKKSDIFLSKNRQKNRQKKKYKNLSFLAGKWKKWNFAYFYRHFINAWVTFFSRPFYGLFFSARCRNSSHLFWGGIFFWHSPIFDIFKKRGSKSKKWHFLMFFRQKNDEIFRHFFFKAVAIFAILGNLKSAHFQTRQIKNRER